MDTTVPLPSTLVPVIPSVDECEQFSILTIGDPHFKEHNSVETGPMTQAVVAQAEFCKPKFIVNLGDTLHDHNSADLTTLTRAANFIKGLGQVAPIYVLIGNHDRINNRDFLTPVHPFPLCESPDIKIIWTTLVEKIGGYWFIFVPYVPKGRFVEALMQGNYADMLKDIVSSNIGSNGTAPSGTVDVDRPWMYAKIIFCHQEFRGVKRGDAVSISGDTWPENAPLIVAGHYHDYQRPQHNIIYTGTPIQHDFDESEDKSLSLLFVNSETVNEQRIRLGLPLKRRAYLTLDDITNYQAVDRLTKIIIRDTTSRLKVALASPIVDQWRKAGFIIGSDELPESGSFTDYNGGTGNQMTAAGVVPTIGGGTCDIALDTIGNCFREPVNFNSIFYNALENDVQRSIFQQHFGSVSSANVPNLVSNVPLAMGLPTMVLPPIQNVIQYQSTDAAFSYI